MSPMTPLSSLLDTNFHLGAQDVRTLAWTEQATQWLPTSWQQSITDLTYSVTGLWDSLVAALMLVF